MRRWILIPLLIFAQTYAQDWTWKSYTSMVHVETLCTSGDTIWGGTEGGVFAFHPQTQTFQLWTNTEGLASNQVTAVISDGMGGVWLGTGDGYLQRFNADNGSAFISDDFADHRICCLVLKEDTLYVGLDIGVSVYLISREEVKETYRRLGDFQVDIPVNDLLISQRTLWAATDEGLAGADLDAVNLLDPESWTSASDAGGPNTAVRSLTVQAGRVYAGTETGVFVYDNGVWDNLPGFPATDIRDLFIHDDVLHAVANTGVYAWVNGWSRVGGSMNDAYIGISVDNWLWTGNESGLRGYSADSDWTTYLPNTPRGNRFNDMAVDLDGVLWCCSSAFEGTGFASFDGSQWAHYSRASHPQFLSDGAVSVAVDADNNKWIGTFGGGIIRTDGEEFTFYNGQNGALLGIHADPTYVVIWDMVVDQENTLWMLNLDAADNLPVIAVPPDDPWTYYGTAQNISSRDLKCIAVDALNRKWIGSYGDFARGLFVLDDNSTPWNPDDDPATENLTTTHGLVSNIITALAGDREGGMWIGTPRGLNYAFSGTIRQQFGLPSDNVTALAVDGADNVWVGTDAGVSVFSSAAYTWQNHFNASNSGLVSNAVLSIFVDGGTGNVYIGTNDGLSCVATPYSAPQDDLESLFIYPNPFVPHAHAQCTIDRLARDVSVSIFTASGYPVRTFQADEVYGRRLLWDGSDDAGRNVSGGVYIVRVTAESGGVVLGKIAVVR